MSGLTGRAPSSPARAREGFIRDAGWQLARLWHEMLERLSAVAPGWDIVPSASVTVVTLPGGQRVRLTLIAEPMPDPPAGGS